MKLLVDPRQLSRIYGLKDQKALRTARIVSPLLIMYLCLLPIGVFAHAFIPTVAISDSDHVMPYLLGTAEVLGPPRQPVEVHALRHSFGTHLSKDGVPLRTAQAAMRHSDPSLTANVYTDPKLLDVVSALVCIACVAA